jgi:hypothetical protein
VIRENKIKKRKRNNKEDEISWDHHYPIFVISLDERGGGAVQAH